MHRSPQLSVDFSTHLCGSRRRHLGCDSVAAHRVCRVLTSVTNPWQVREARTPRIIVVRHSNPSHRAPSQPWAHQEITPEPVPRGTTSHPVPTLIVHTSPQRPRGIRRIAIFSSIIRSHLATSLTVLICAMPSGQTCLPTEQWQCWRTSLNSWGAARLPKNAG